MRYNLLAKCEVEGTGWLFVVPWEKEGLGVGLVQHTMHTGWSPLKRNHFCSVSSLTFHLIFFFCDVVYISSAALFSEVCSCHQWYLSLYLEG